METPLCPCPEQCSMNKISNDPEDVVFLCYSDSEKDFVHQLHVDLRRRNISSSYDKLHQSSPEDPHFLCHIKNYRVAVLVYSPSFFNGESKRPMLELAKIVQARQHAVLPLCYLTSHQELYDQLEGELKNKWGEKYKEWRDALKNIRSVNAINRSDCTTDVDYREDIVSKIVQLFPPNPGFDVSHVEGRERLCSVVDEMFKKVEDKKGVKVLGLHGIEGCGKTTICKCLCNFYKGEFKGKVFHLEFGSEAKEAMEQTRKRLLQVVAPEKASYLASSEDQQWDILKKRMKDHKVFLALDNVDDKDMTEIFLNLVYKEGSKIVVSSRQANVFKSGYLRPGEIPSEDVPCLEEDETINILLNGTLADRKELSSQEEVSSQEEKLRNFAKKCIVSDAYNPSKLKKMCDDSCGMFGSDPTKWEDIPNLVDLHSVPEKLDVYCDLMTNYLNIGKKKPALYLGMNFLFARIFLNELFDTHCILAKAFLIQLLNGTESKGLILFLTDLLEKEECKKLFNGTASGRLTSIMEEFLNADFKELLNGNEIKNVVDLFTQVLYGK